MLTHGTLKWSCLDSHPSSPTCQLTLSKLPYLPSNGTEMVLIIHGTVVKKNDYPHGGDGWLNEYKLSLLAFYYSTGFMSHPFRVRAFYPFQWYPPAAYSRNWGDDQLLSKALQQTAYLEYSNGRWYISNQRQCHNTPVSESEFQKEFRKQITHYSMENMTATEIGKRNRKISLFISREILQHFLCIYWQKSIGRIENTWELENLGLYHGHNTTPLQTSMSSLVGTLLPVLIFLKDHMKRDRKVLYSINCLAI